MKGGIYQALPEPVVDRGLYSVLVAVRTHLKDLMGHVWTLMTSNPYLVLFIAAALIPIGVSVFRSIKRAARR